MSKTDAWMPLYISDYLADTMHLNAVQHGAYILLLMHHWRNGKLPLADTQLASIARADLAAWKKSIWPVIKDFFDKTDDGWTQKRLLSEMERADENNKKRSEAGAKAAEKRWQTHSKRIANASESQCDCNAEDHANGMRSGYQNDTPSPLPIKAVALGTDRDSARPPQAADAPSDPFPRYTNPPGKPPMPCRGDPPDAWKHLAPLEADGDGPKRAAAGGYFLDTAAELVCEAAQIRDEHWRGDWRPLIAWLRDNIDLHAVIIPAIRQVAARPNYRVPASLQYFDRAVRQAHASAAA